MKNQELAAKSVQPKVTITHRLANPKMPGWDIVKVKCPSCGKTHTHGLHENDPLPQHRVTDCGLPGGYWIIDG